MMIDAIDASYRGAERVLNHPVIGAQMHELSCMSKHIADTEGAFSSSSFLFCSFSLRWCADPDTRDPRHDPLAVPVGSCHPSPDG